MDTTNNKIKKNECKRTYMREYMRKYNMTRNKNRPRLTEEEKRESTKQSHKKYYMKNKDKILKTQKKKIVTKRIEFLNKKLLDLEVNV